MTFSEKEQMKYSLLVGIDESIKSIQVQAAHLKNPEDSVKNLATIMKIQDSIADIRRVYAEIDNLDSEDAEMEEEYNETDGYDVNSFTDNLFNMNF